MNESTLTATLLANGPYERCDAPFGLLQVTGKDAGAFLQRLCTQDVLGLAEGEVAPAAFLDAKGKVQFTVLIWPVVDGFVMETHREQREGLLALLERYHFTEQVTIAAVDAGACAELVSAAESPARRAERRDAGWVVRFARRGVQFERSYGGEPAGDGATLDAALAESLRMAAGLVRVGVETEPSTLALEADLDDHCSTRKGCYTGQEIVARIHTYGHVNRKLCLLQLVSGDPIEAPATLVELEDELPVGRVMHAVAPLGQDLRVGLGYLPADFQAIGTKLALEGGGSVEVAGFA